jgi:hypothetical protein
MPNEVGILPALGSDLGSILFSPGNSSEECILSDAVLWSVPFPQRKTQEIALVIPPEDAEHVFIQVH